MSIKAQAIIITILGGLVLYIAINLFNLAGQLLHI
jgi:hypothetical protein